MGIYTATIGAAATAVVDTFTQVPGQPAGSFFDNWTNQYVDISGNEIAFSARNVDEPKASIYKTDLLGNVSIVADFNTPVPGHPFSEFFGFSVAPSIVDGVTVIRASTWDGELFFDGVGV